MSCTPDIDGTGSGSLLEPDTQMHTCIFESSKLKYWYIGKPYGGPTVYQITVMSVPGLFDSQHVILLLLLFLRRSVCPSTLERRKGAHLSPSRLFNGSIPFPQPRSYTCTHTETHAHTHTHTHSDSLPWARSSRLLSSIHSGGSRPSRERLAINPKVWLRFPTTNCHIAPSLLAPAGLREGTMPNTAPETLPVWL